MAKRGRPRKDGSTTPQRKGYFYEKEEQAVLEYLSAETKEEKEAIFKETLEAPLTKMVESILRRYKLYIPDEISGDTFNDTFSFLLTKADKFEPGKYKAYSYYGTICKNYLIGRIENYSKRQMRNPSLELMKGEIYDNLKYADNGKDKNTEVAESTIAAVTRKIKIMIHHPKNYGLKENEIKLGKALVSLLENWEYVLSTDGSNKLNKNVILLFLKENTGLDAKGIRDNLKKYKKEFLIIKDEILREEYQ